MTPLQFINSCLSGSQIINEIKESTQYEEHELFGAWVAECALEDDGVFDMTKDTIDAHFEQLSCAVKDVEFDKEAALKYAERLVSKILEDVSYDYL